MQLGKRTVQRAESQAQLFARVAAAALERGDLLLYAEVRDRAQRARTVARIGTVRRLR